MTVDKCLEDSLYYLQDKNKSVFTCLASYYVPYDILQFASSLELPFWDDTNRKKDTGSNTNLPKAFNNVKTNTAYVFIATRCVYS